MKNSNYVTKEFLEKLSEEVKNGYVTIHENPDKKIFNYTYSRLTEQENHWNEITLRTRGLILDSNGRIIFNCPRKFFNFQQNNFANDTYERLKDDFKIYEKLDGSAIWVVNDSEYGFIVSSKSSFTSEHATWAKEIIEQKFKEKDLIFKEGICYCFELIHPENRIVVDYGEEKTLKLWGLKTQSGETIELEDNRIDTSYFETPKFLGTNNDKTAIDNAIVALRERNFDGSGVIEITPAVYNIFKNNLIELSTNNPELIKKGVVGMYDNYTVIMSNNLAVDPSTEATRYVYCDVRSKDAIAFAGQINEVEAGRMEKRFSDYVRGLDTFGAKTIANDELQVVKIPLA